jgi:hypothetical protein
MDAFEQIAMVFEKDCLHRLAVLENAAAILEHSESTAIALRLLFVQSEIYADDYEHLKTIPTEIDRLRNCIAATEVIVLSSQCLATQSSYYVYQETIDQARKLFTLNFGDAKGVFCREICYSYTCKLLNSVGPRLHHFSGSPTSSEVVNAELYLALHSPYIFEEDDLYCYESM